jgi:hypothetical protein
MDTGSLLCLTDRMTVPTTNSLSLSLALVAADAGFLEAVDALALSLGISLGLAALRSQVLDAMRMTAAWLAGVASGACAVTIESATATRAAAHRAGLPVVGGGR